MTTFEQELKLHIELQQQAKEINKNHYRSSFQVNPLLSKVYTFKAKTSYSHGAKSMAPEEVILAPTPAWLESLNSPSEKQAISFFEALEENLCDIAKIDDFKTFYRKMAKKVHPDLNPNMSDMAFISMKRHLKTLKNAFIKHQSTDENTKKMAA